MIWNGRNVSHSLFSMLIAVCLAAVVDAFIPETAGRCRKCHRSSVTRPSPANLDLTLFQSTATVMDSNNSTTSVASDSSQSTSNEPTTMTTRLTDTKRPLRTYDMPWSEFQEWAMKDHLSKYTIQVHIENDGKDTLQVYTLWRTLSNEVMALSGYPLKFLVERYQEIKKDLGITTSTEILPYLDGYAFKPDGGVSGRVYGIAGVAEGTRIQTTPVAGVESTLQKGYILTQEGIVYELGLPASETDAWDGRMAQRSSLSMSSSASSDMELGDLAENGELVKLGALTAIVISGAWAMEALSHHLTVNVFWV